MNKEDPYRNQAERLRKKIDRNQEQGEKSAGKEAMPPRSRLHQEKKKKNKFKIKYPVIRLLALFFILLPVTIYSMYNYISKERLGKSGKVDTTPSGYETVNFEESEKVTKVEEREIVPENDRAKSDGDQAKDGELTIPIAPRPNQEVTDDKGSAVPADQKDKQKKEDKQKEEKQQLKEKEKQTEIKEELGVKYHTVKPNDNMFRIALKYYQSQSGVEVIKKANNLKSDEIRVGQVLVIPAK